MRVGKQREPRRHIGARRRDRFRAREHRALAGTLDRLGIGGLEAGDGGPGCDRASDQIGGALIERTPIIRPVALIRAIDIGPAEYNRDDDDGDTEDQRRRTRSAPTA